ncbi:MAG TPA: HAMP domain-containing sensor histidine kinase, partial [Azonexus sp.]|nr:HAMP domain-containing sensor histidine kinase [Azonexus sp.]
LLELARADVMQPASEIVDPGAVMAQVAARYREQGLAVTVDQTGSHAPVAIDGDTLDSVLSNLLDNARQHGGREVQVGIDAQPDEGSVVLTVRDNGPGISDANAARVFEPFFTTARSQGGTGLGLAVVRALVRAHGGDVWLGNSGGRGSTFHVRLPRAKNR